MDANVLNSVILVLVGAAVFFYILYGVIRAATRDGIIDSRRRVAKAEESQDESSFLGN